MTVSAGTAASIGRAGITRSGTMKGKRCSWRGRARCAVRIVYGRAQRSRLQSRLAPFYQASKTRETEQGGAHRRHAKIAHSYEQ